MHVFSVVIPAYQSYPRSPTLDRKRSLYEEWTFENFLLVLQTPDLFIEFREYAIRDFSSESVVFYQMYNSFLASVVDLLNKTEEREKRIDFTSVLGYTIPHDALGECRAIYDMFFKRGADYELNVNYGTVKKIQDKLKQSPENWTMNLYAEAYEEIMQLLFSDTYFKFTKYKSSKSSA